jgi:hypothetical protein
MRARTRIRVGLPLAAASLIAASASVHAGPKDVQKDSQGQSQAVLARLVPYVGLPGVTTSVGLVTAQVANGTAQSSAAMTDFGLLGTLAGGAASGQAPDGVPAPELPSPISADSEGTTNVERDPFAASGAPALPATGTGSSDPQAFLGHESATATKDPLAATGTVLGPTLALPGVFELSGARSTATSTKTGSLSEVTLSSLNLGDGQVVLSGLRWVANQVGSKNATSGFSLGGLTVAGQAMPVDSPAELASSLAQANEQLEPLGLVLDAPTQVADATGGSVAPLVIQIRNPEALVDPTNQASAALAPVVTQLMEAVIAANPDAAAAQIVANALVGGAGGRSGGRLEIGGVSARSALVELDAGYDAVTDAATGGGALPSTASSVVPADTPAVDSAAVGDIPASDVPADTNLTPAQTPATQNAALGTKDDDNSLAIIALALGLAAVVVLALGDRLRMAAGAK